MVGKNYIGVVAFNNPEEIKRLAEGIARFKALDGDWTFVILDHSNLIDSRDAISAFCKRRNWIYIQQENRGFGAGVNTIARTLNLHDTLLMCNPDLDVVGVPPFQKMFDCISTEEYDLIGTTIRDRFGQACAGPLPQFGLRMVAYDYTSLPRQFKQKSSIGKAGIWYGAVHGACFAMNVGKFLSVEGFDENLFMYGEEFDLNHKFQSCHYTVGFLPSDSLNHESEGNLDIRRELLNLYNLRYLAKTRGKYLLFIYFSIRYCLKVFSTKNTDLRKTLFWTNIDRKRFLQ